MPNVHEQVLYAINGTTNTNKIRDIGVMEFFSIAASIVAADAAVKSANVDLLEVRLGIGIGGKAFVTLTGEVSSVKNAIKAGTQASISKGMLVNKTVISGPSKQLIQFMI